MQHLTNFGVWHMKIFYFIHPAPHKTPLQQTLLQIYLSFCLLSLLCALRCCCCELDFKMFLMFCAKTTIVQLYNLHGTAWQLVWLQTVLRRAVPCHAIPCQSILCHENENSFGFFTDTCTKRRSYHRTISLQYTLNCVFVFIWFHCALYCPNKFSTSAVVCSVVHFLFLRWNSFFLFI